MGGDYDIGSGFGFLIGFVCVATACVLVGGYLLIDWLFIDHNIRSKKPVKPLMEIKYNQKTGVPDTTYVYVRP